jgi:hypothetical protein
MRTMGTNPFLIATENSFKNALILCQHHDNALAVAAKTDPEIASIYNVFHLLCEDYTTKYHALGQQENTQVSKTVTINQLLTLLSSTKIREWDQKIQDVYPLKSAGYQALLPGRRGPFQSGTKLDRLSAMQILDDSLTSETALTDVKTDVASFNTQLKAANTTQKTNIKGTQTKSNELEASRIAMCVGLLGDWGLLTHKFAATPEKVIPFYDMDILNRVNQVFFTGHLKAGAIYNIVKHTFGVDDKVYLATTGNTPLKFYLAGTNNAQPGTKSYTLASGHINILASELGNLTDPYLMVENLSTTSTGAFEIEIL